MESTPRAPDDVPDCKVCAACCFSERERYVTLTGADHARLRLEEQRALTVFHGTRCYMKMVDGHCIALEQRGDEWLCSVYERRPQLCRDYERGGAACAVDRVHGKHVAGRSGHGVCSDRAQGKGSNR